MKTKVFVLFSAGLAAGLALSAPANADSYWELEAARANARAGGPVSERDAELLERYGCLSGTKSAFCERLSQRDRRAWRTDKRKRARN